MKIQDTFRQFLRERFAPAMRDLGFKGSGQKYSFPSDTHYIQIGLQKSAYSDSNELQFTLNFQIIEKKEWMKEKELIQPSTPKPNPNIHERIGYTERIGLMTPKNLDLWWTYGLDTSELDLLEEVIVMIRKYIIPMIELNKTNEAQQDSAGNLG